MPRLIALTLLACSGGLQPRRVRVNRIRRSVQDETWIAAEDQPKSYLDTLTKKMADSLLANSLEIQVPGPGAAREGDFHAAYYRKKLAAFEKGDAGSISINDDFGGDIVKP